MKYFVTEINPVETQNIASLRVRLFRGKINMSDDIPVITIDGPSGAGKGTICQLLAKELGWQFLDSGALYRVLALAAKQHSVNLDNEKALEILAAHLDVQFQATDLGSPTGVILEGEDVGEVIRSEECGSGASQIAALPAVRQALLARQREFRQSPGLVADGRDMGTVIFPEAGLKIFLEAEPLERANRRYLQLKSKGISVSLARIEKELIGRDQRDKGRATAPLVAASDAVLLDTTGLSINEVLNRALQLARQAYPALLKGKC